MWFVSLHVLGSKFEGLVSCKRFVFVFGLVSEVREESNPVFVFERSFCRSSIECWWGSDLIRGDGFGVARGKRRGLCFTSG